MKKQNIETKSEIIYQPIDFKQVDYLEYELKLFNIRNFIITKLMSIGDKDPQTSCDIIEDIFEKYGTSIYQHAKQIATDIISLKNHGINVHLYEEDICYNDLYDYLVSSGLSSGHPDIKLTTKLHYRDKILKDLFKSYNEYTDALIKTHFHAKNYKHLEDGWTDYVWKLF